MRQLPCCMSPYLKPRLRARSLWVNEMSLQKVPHSLQCKQRRPMIHWFDKGFLLSVHCTVQYCNLRALTMASCEQGSGILCVLMRHQLRLVCKPWFNTCDAHQVCCTVSAEVWTVKQHIGHLSSLESTPPLFSCCGLLHISLISDLWRIDCRPRNHPMPWILIDMWTHNILHVWLQNYRMTVL